MNKTALYISIALSAFILVSVLGVGFAMKAQPQLGTTEVVGTVPVGDAALPKEIQAREAR